MWSICGLHDKNFPERPVYGKVRYMSYNGCKGKFDLPAFVNRYKTLKRPLQIKPQTRQYSTQKQHKEDLESQPWQASDAQQWEADDVQSWADDNHETMESTHHPASSHQQSWADYPNPSGRHQSRDYERNQVVQMSGGSSHTSSIHRK